jgi:hypothetical protein
MRKLIYPLFLSVFLADYLHGEGLLPRVATFLPELLSMAAVVLVVFLAVSRKVVHLSPLYVFLFLLIGLHIFFGTIVNQVPTTTVFVGIRTYFRYLPFFLLPLVYDFSEKELQGQIAVLMVLSAIQLPISVYQRFVESAGLLTGDFVQGTLGSSGTLTIYLLCAVAMLMAFSVRDRITRPVLFGTLAVFVVPTMINETKITLFLLPIALILPALFMGGGSQKVRRLISIILLGVVVLGVFVPVYDHFVKSRWGYGILDFFTMEGRVEGYLTKEGADIRQGKIGRLDGILLPIEKLSDDPVDLMFGLGIGNVSDSAFGDRFTGAYFREYGSYVYGSMSQLLWEVGLLGVFLLTVLYSLIFRDAMYLRSMASTNGAFALGWACVVCMVVMTLFYGNLIHSSAVSYLFWYFSGYMAALAVRRKMQAEPGLSM